MMTQTMTAIRLHGPQDLRVETIPYPDPPQGDDVIIKVKAIGICGSDLHSYLDARIGDTPIEEPMVMGHEFSGVVAEVGAEALDGLGQPLQRGSLVAVDPAQPCFRCSLCEQGHPNLCRRLHFCGVFPDPGSFAEYIRMPARSCFPLPGRLDAEDGALLEPLGVALHAMDLAKIKLGESVVIQGAGAIGLLILQLAKLSGAGRIYVTDQFPWRLKLAQQLGAYRTINFREENPVEIIQQETNQAGVDLCIEAAWCDQSVNEAITLVALGGRVLLVGISSDDQIHFSHAAARRKGLTIKMSRRMKHVYPRCIDLVQSGQVQLKKLISHRFPLDKTPEAFQLNTTYRDQVHKIMICL